MKLELDKIRTDGGTQPRAALRIDVVEEYAELMRMGIEFPPVTVYFDGENYWLTDGFHRLKAARQARPGQPIEADVIQGSLSDAQWHSFGVNKTHGLRRSNEDKKRAVQAALNHPQAAGKSNGQIAAHCGVDEKTVRKYRNGMTPTSTSEIPESDSRSIDNRLKPSPPRPRTGRDGRTINTAKIDKRPSKPCKSNGRRTAASQVYTPIRGHSKPLRMIPLQFCPENPHTAAATLIELFPQSFLEALVQELTQHLQQQGA